MIHAKSVSQSYLHALGCPSDHLCVDVLQKNAMVGGAMTGALISAVSNKNKDQIIVDAIRGGAVATAAEILNYLT